MDKELLNLISEQLMLPIEVVKNIELLDVELAKSIGEVNLSSCHLLSEEPPAQYSVMLDAFGVESDLDIPISYLMRLKPSDLVSSEHQEKIKSHPTYKDYLTLSKFGSEPPPVSVILHSNGSMVCQNRRRLLVAQELNKSVNAWVQNDTFSDDGVDCVLTLGRYRSTKEALSDAFINKHPEFTDIDEYKAYLASQGFDVSRVFYHGTSVDFEISDIDINKFGENEAEGDYVGKALFFTPDRSKALRYARSAGGCIVKEVYLKIENPLVVPEEGLDSSYYDDIDPAKYFNEEDLVWLGDESREAAFFEMTQEELREYAISKGYDGLVDNSYNQRAVFDKEQVAPLTPPSLMLKCSSPSPKIAA